MRRGPGLGQGLPRDRHPTRRIGRLPWRGYAPRPIASPRLGPALHRRGERRLPERGHGPQPGERVSRPWSRPRRAERRPPARRGSPGTRGCRPVHPVDLGEPSLRARLPGRRSPAASNHRPSSRLLHTSILVGERATMRRRRWTRSRRASRCWSISSPRTGLSFRWTMSVAGIATTTSSATCSGSDWGSPSLTLSWTSSTVGPAGGTTRTASTSMPSAMRGQPRNRSCLTGKDRIRRASVHASGPDAIGVTLPEIRRSAHLRIVYASTLLGNWQTAAGSAADDEPPGSQRPADVNREGGAAQPASGGRGPGRDDPDRRERRGSAVGPHADARRWSPGRWVTPMRSSAGRQRPGRVPDALSMSQARSDPMVRGLPDRDRRNAGDREQDRPAVPKPIEASSAGADLPTRPPGAQPGGRIVTNGTTERRNETSRA